MKSKAYICQQTCNCRVLLTQEAAFPLALARLKAGNNIEARIAMMAITTRSSMRVKAGDARRLVHCLRPLPGSCRGRDFTTETHSTNPRTLKCAFRCTGTRRSVLCRTARRGSRGSGSKTIEVILDCWYICSGVNTAIVTLPSPFGNPVIGWRCRKAVCERFPDAPTRILSNSNAALIRVPMCQSQQPVW